MPPRPPISPISYYTSLPTVPPRLSFSTSGWRSSCTSDPSLSPCARQPDGSVHGNARSYGKYNGTNVSISMMLVDDGRKSWRRLCDTPNSDTPQACT